MQIKVERLRRRRNDGQQHVLSVSLAVTSRAVLRFLFVVSFLLFLSFYSTSAVSILCLFFLLAACPLRAIVVTLLTSLCLRIHDLASYSIRSLHLSSDRAQNSLPSFLGNAVGLAFKGGCKISLFNLDFLTGLWFSVIIVGNCKNSFNYLDD